jgi:hypothetical protein
VEESKEEVLKVVQMMAADLLELLLVVVPFSVPEVQIFLVRREHLEKKEEEHLRLEHWLLSLGLQLVSRHLRLHQQATCLVVELLVWWQEGLISLESMSS